MEKPLATTELGRMVGKRIAVHVKDDREFRDTLKRFDDHMNLVLEDVEECVESGVKDKHKLIVLKGGNLQSIEL